MRKTIAAAAIAVLLPLTAHAADKIKLGFMYTMSGPIGALGNDAKRGLDQALEELGGTLGGVPVEVVVADDRLNPAEAVQIASRFIERDKVDIVTGVGASNVMMAAHKPILDAGIWLISNAGPSPLAGKQCHENAFFVAFQNDQWNEGMGLYMNQKGVRRLYLMGMDYQAGWDHIAGARRTYKGEVVNQVFTPLAQLDFSPELAQLRAAKPDALYAFYVGGPAIAFIKQYAQAGLMGQIPLYSMGAIADELTFPAQGDAALGLVSGTSWNVELDNPANRKFVADFRTKHGRNPTVFVQGQYDAIKLLDRAVAAVKGRIEDKAAFRAALRKADFQSARGPFRFNNNHFPIQNIYVQQVAKNDKGELYQKLVATAVQDLQDSYHQDCAMQWE